MTGEKALHQQLSAWLKKQGIPFFHSRMDTKTSQACGDPDYLCVLNGRVAMVELKFGNGKLSKAQQERIQELECRGCPVMVARTVEEAIHHVSTALGLTEATGGAHSASNEASAAAPKEYLASARYVGDVVVARNPEGHVGFVRKARDTDVGLPRWTEALGW